MVCDLSVKSIFNEELSRRIEVVIFTYKHEVIPCFFLCYLPFKSSLKNACMLNKV